MATQVVPTLERAHAGCSTSGRIAIIATRRHVMRLPFSEQGVGRALDSSGTHCRHGDRQQKRPTTVVSLKWRPCRISDVLAASSSPSCSCCPVRRRPDAGAGAGYYCPAMHGVKGCRPARFLILVLAQGALLSIAVQPQGTFHLTPAHRLLFIGSSQTDNVLATESKQLVKARG
jgi:hypothetical protein